MIKNIVRIIILAVMVFGTVTFAAAATESAYTKATLLNQDPDPAEPGDYVELRWKVVKYGNGELENVTYKLDVDYPFYFDKIDEPVKKLGSWDGYSDEEEYFTLYYKVMVDDDAEEGTYEVDLITDSGGDVTKQRKEYEIRVDEKDKPDFVIGSIQSEPVKLVSGADEAKLAVEVVNVGDGQAENVRTVLNLPPSFESSYSYSDRDVLGSLEGGNSKIAEYYVDINDTAQAGAYNATLELGYSKSDDDDDEYYKTTIPVQIEVKSKPMFDVVDYHTEPEIVKQGESADLRVTVKNTGSEEGESVSVKVFKESSQPFEFEDKSDYVGRLKPGQTGEAVLSFNIDDDADVKSYLMDLEIRSIDDNEVFLDDEIVKIRVDAADKKGLSALLASNTGENITRNSVSGSNASPLIGVAIIFVIVLAGVLGFFGWKKFEK